MLPRSKPPAKPLSLPGTPSPGPWELHSSHIPGYERVLSIVGSDGISIAKLDGAGSYNPKVVARVEANANILCAAPLLLDGIRRALKETNPVTLRKQLRATLDAAGIPS